MAAKIGILGESTIVTADTTTILYTVPASKAARVKVLFAVEAGAGAYQFSVLIGSPGSEIHQHFSNGSGVDGWSGMGTKATPDPALSLVEADIGLQKLSSGVILTVLTSTFDWIIAPLTPTYYLATGDTVRVDLRGTEALDLIAQVIGVEDDA